MSPITDVGAAHVVLHRNNDWIIFEKQLWFAEILINTDINHEVMVESYQRELYYAFTVLPTTHFAKEKRWLDLQTQVLTVINPQIAGNIDIW